MLCNPISSFPDTVDEQPFFQDVDLNHLPIMEHYDELISQHKYNEANAYMNQQSGIYGYFADFFNLIENRIETLQTYLLKKEKINPFVSSDDEPDTLSDNTIWI